VAVVLLFPAGIRAQEKPAAAAPSAKSDPPDTRAPIDRLQFLLGDWEFTEKYEKTPSFAGGEGHGVYSTKLGPGGYSVITDFQSSSAAEGDVVGHEIITWDSEAKEYKQYTFGNSFPLAYIATGHWQGEKLVFEGDFEFAGSSMHIVRDVWPTDSGGFNFAESYKTGSDPLRLTLTTTAQKPSGAAAKNEAGAPQLTAEMQKLKFLIGDWNYAQPYKKSPSMPEGGEGTGTYRAWAGPGGESILTDFIEKTGPMAGAAGHEIFVWDAKQNEYVGYTFVSNAPGCFIRNGHFEDGHLVFHREIAGRKGSIKMRYVYAEPAADTVMIETSIGVGDAPLALAFTTKATRQ
jgi:hypothetical protein